MAGIFAWICYRSHQSGPSAQGADHSGGNGGDAIRCSSGKDEIAIAACSHIIDDKRETADNRAIALRNRAFHYQQMGDFDHAIADYTMGLQRPEPHPLQAKTHLNRGLMYALKGDEANALLDYSEAVTLDSTLASAYINRATLYIKRSNYELALGDLDRAAALKPLDAEILVSRGSIHAHRGEANFAIADFTKAIEFDPKNAVAWRGRSFAYRSIGENDKAAADAAEALRLNPELAGAHLDLGLSHQGAGNAEQAIAEFDKAIKQNPRDAQAIKARGDAYFAKGDSTHAIADFGPGTLELEPEYDGRVSQSRSCVAGRIRMGGRHCRLHQSADLGLQSICGLPEPRTGISSQA